MGGKSEKSGDQPQGVTEGKDPGQEGHPPDQ